MKLFHRFLGGEGRPLLVLHGLFGSSKNWISNGKALTKYRQVHLLDLRNHGESPHSEIHSLQEMAHDLKDYILDLQDKPDLLGHSMGGLTCTLVSLLHPELIGSPIIVDISPRSYPVKFGNEFLALEMDVSGFQSREEIDRKMQEFIPDTFLRQFLQMNLEKTETGYRWKINVDAIKSGREKSLQFPDNLRPFTGNSLFILGEKSEYITESDPDIIRTLFPHARIEIIPGGGHYLHYFQSDIFLEVCGKFLGNS